MKIGWERDRMSNHLVPVQLRLLDDHRLEIEWNDGRRDQLSPLKLRQACPCATCREKQRTPAPNKLQLNILSQAELAPTRVVGMRPVGNYAYQIAFSDGHDSGIFSLELLRNLGEVTS